MTNIFPILRSRSFLPYFQLHELHFDHRVFNWKHTPICTIDLNNNQNVYKSSSFRLLHPSNLDVLMTTNKTDIISMNERLLIPEAIQLQVAPIYKKPFVFDHFATKMYVLTDDEHYDHLLMLTKYGLVTR